MGICSSHLAQSSTTSTHSSAPSHSHLRGQSAAHLHVQQTPSATATFDSQFSTLPLPIQPPLLKYANDRSTQYTVRSMDEDGAILSATANHREHDHSPVRRHTDSNLLASVTCKSSSHIRSNTSASIISKQLRPSVDHALVLHEDAINDIIVIGSDSLETMTASTDRSVVRYNWKNKSVLNRWQKHSKAVLRLAYSSSSDCVFTGGRDSTIRQFPLLQRKPSAPSSPSPFNSDNTEIQCFRGHLLPITSLSTFSNNLLFSSSRDYSVRWWDIERGEQIGVQTIQGMISTCGRRMHNGDDYITCTASEDCQLRFWDNRTHDIIQQYSTGNEYVSQMDISADGNYISTCRSSSLPTSPSPLSIIDRRTGNELPPLGDELDSFSNSIFLPSMVGGNSLLACVSRTNTLKIFDISTGDCLSSFTSENSSDIRNLGCAIDATGSLLSAKSAVFYSSTLQGIVQQWQVNNLGNVASLLAQTRHRSSSAH